MARKPHETVGLVLRFPEHMRRRIEKAAKAHNTSMNAEIIERLAASFRREDQDDVIKKAANLMRNEFSPEWRPPARPDFLAPPQEAPKSQQSSEPKKEGEDDKTS